MALDSRAFVTCYELLRGGNGDLESFGTESKVGKNFRGTAKVEDIETLESEDEDLELLLGHFVVIKLGSSRAIYVYVFVQQYGVTSTYSFKRIAKTTTIFIPSAILLSPSALACYRYSGVNRSQCGLLLTAQIAISASHDGSKSGLEHGSMQP